MEILVGAAATAGASGATAATTGLLGAGGFFGTAGTLTGAGFGTLLSTGMTGASAFGQIMAGQSQAAIMRFQARQAELQARTEEIKGRQQSLAIREQLERDVATASATFAARGVLAGQGSALAAVQAGKERASRDLEAAQFNTANAADSLRGQAGQYRKEASLAITSGLFGAATTIGDSRSFRS